MIKSLFLLQKLFLLVLGDRSLVSIICFFVRYGRLLNSFVLVWIIVVHVNTNRGSLCKHSKCPGLLIWGHSPPSATLLDNKLLIGTVHTTRVICHLVTPLRIHSFQSTIQHALRPFHSIGLYQNAFERHLYMYCFRSSLSFIFSNVNHDNNIWIGWRKNFNV